MKNSMKKFGFCILGIIALVSCEKDDLCDGGDSETPNVIINLFDKIDSELAKPAVKIGLIANGFSDTIVFKNSSKIEIPLQINNNETTWSLLLYEPTATNDTIIKKDELKFTYSPEAIYVSKACGYKTNFYNFNAIKTPNTSTTSWIQSIYKLTTEISTENNAHIQLYY